MDAYFPEPVGKFPTAVLITFEDELMKVMELFYDPRPILPKQDKIFEN